MVDQTSRADHGAILVSWKFPEFPRYVHTRGWYFGMSVLGLALLVFSFYSSNPLFAIFVIIAWALIFFRSRQRPIELTANITEDGIEVGQDFFDYDDIDRFWIIYNPPHTKTMYLRFKSALRAVLGISIEDTDPTLLRRELRRFITEDLEKEEEPASDAYGRLFKL